MLVGSHFDLESVAAAVLLVTYMIPAKAGIAGKKPLRLTCIQSSDCRSRLVLWRNSTNDVAPLQLLLRKWAFSAKALDRFSSRSSCTTLSYSAVAGESNGSYGAYHSTSSSHCGRYRCHDHMANISRNVPCLKQRLIGQSTAMNKVCGRLNGG
jgi:hypothetical protein